LIVKEISKSDSERRLKALRKIWSGIAPKIKDLTGMTPKMASGYYIERGFDRNSLAGLLVCSRQDAADHFLQFGDLAHAGLVYLFESFLWRAADRALFWWLSIDGVAAD